MKVCFLRLNGYALFNPIPECFFGGVEVRSYLFAKGLAKLGIEVDFLVHDFGQNNIEIYDQIKVIKGPKAPVFEAGKLIPQSNKIVHEELKNFVENSDYDAFLCFGVNQNSAAVIETSQKKGIKTVLFVTSDTDLNNIFYENSEEIGVYGEHGHTCWKAIMNADEIIVQSIFQLQILQERFNRKGVLITNPVDLNTDEEAHQKEGVLWIGRSDLIQKQPLVALEIAKNLPEIPFLMIVNKSDPKIFDQMLSENLGNLTMIEKVDYSKIESYYAKSRFLISTSLFEGFPNSFLQAGKFSTPILSLNVDPNSILSKSEGGICFQGDQQKMIKTLRRLYFCQHKANGMGKKLREFVSKNHKLEEKAKELVLVCFSNLVI